MLEGLEMMSMEELTETARLIGIDSPPTSRQLLYDVISGWMTIEVQAKSEFATEIERAILEWTARAFKITFNPLIASDDLERAIRLKIASDAANYLNPSWKIVCALIATGKKENINTKLTLLEEAASIAVPSQTTLRKLRENWDTLTSHWMHTRSLDELSESLEAIAGSPELDSQCLTLGLAISLLDGGIPFPTEQLYREIATRLGFNSGQIIALQKKVNDLYWRHHDEFKPGQELGENSIVSKECSTVFKAGAIEALEALAADARQRLLSTIEPEPQKKGWSRLMGGLSGISSFFSEKVKGDNKATLARIVYHTIIKQHLAVVAQKRRAAIATQATSSLIQQQKAQSVDNVVVEPAVVKVEPASESPISPLKVENFPPGAPLEANVLAETVEQSTSKRRIKLDL